MTNLSIPKQISILIAVLLAPLALPMAHAESEAQYEAVFSDGSRVEGNKVFGWYEHPGYPRLDDTALYDAKRPLRWLRDRKLKPWRPDERCSGYIEFVGGDRLVGRVVGAKPGSDAEDVYVPAHLLVQRPAPPDRPARGSTKHMRVLPARIQRVVFGSASHRRLQPGTLYYRNSRRMGFVRLRWQEDSVALLLKDGMSEVKLSEIGEIHFPQIDPWQAYYRELAVLSPACRSRMLRIETTSGLIATGSELRFGAAPHFTREQKKRIIEQIDGMDKQVAGIQGKRKDNQLKLDKARGGYQRQLAESEKQTKAEQQAYQKASDQMRQRIDELRKKDVAEWTKRREQLVRELKAVEQEMQDWLTRIPAGKHDEIIETFHARQAQLRKSREKPLEDERLKLEKDDKQRQEEFDRFIKAQTRKLQQRIKELQNQTAARKKQFEQETKRWEAFLKRLESLKSRRASFLSEQSANWSHILQPAWSLDPLRVRFHSIHMRWSFAPQEVPLCRVRPAATVSPPLLPRYTNRNSAGRPLRSGGRQYAWGFAVHAYSELRFPLPKCASAFRSSIGLDHIVGPGGCARARVYVGSTSGKPVYESPLLVGWKKTADTGRVALGLPSDGPRHLILQADPANNDSPPGADPLNIRDQLDWLDPRIEIDAARLRKQVRLKIGPLIAGSRGWTLGLDNRGVYTWTSRFNEEDIQNEARFWTMLRAEGQPLTLWREMTVGPTNKWLAVHLGVPSDAPPHPDTVVLRVGGQQVQPRKIPLKQLWQNRPAPLLFPLDKYQGKKVKLELTQPVGGKPLHWQAVSIASFPPPEYRLVDIMEFVGKGDMQVPYALGMALQSNRLDKTEKLAALEITQFGGIVNFVPSQADEIAPGKLDNILVGNAWKGGDKTFLKTFMTFKKMPSLKKLLVTRDSSITDGAIAKLQAEIPKLSIARFIKRVPSVAGGRGGCSLTLRNSYRKTVVILYIDFKGNLQFSSTPLLRPGQQVRRSGQAGIQYEAHYHRGDFVRPTDYIYNQPLSSLLVSGNGFWDIKPGGE